MDVPGKSQATHILTPEFISAARAQAEADASLVGEFIRKAGIQSQNPDGSWQQLVIFPEWLLAIAVGLRLQRWESHQIRLHINSGLPSAAEFYQTFRSFPDQLSGRKYVSTTYGRVMTVYQQSFVWSASDFSFHADVALMAEDDEAEAFLDAVADFVWKMAQ